MKMFRVVVLALGVIHALFAGLTALTGGFADGGDLWSRLTLMLIHPVTAAVLLYMVVLNAPPRRLLMIGSAVILVNVIADASLALSILAGNMRGDWWLALVFSAVPIIALIYAVTLLTRRTE